MSDINRFLKNVKSLGNDFGDIVYFQPMKGTYIQTASSEQALFDEITNPFQYQVVDIKDIRNSNENMPSTPFKAEEVIEKSVEESKKKMELKDYRHPMLIYGHIG